MDADKVDTFLAIVARVYQEFVEDGYSKVAASVAAINEAESQISLNDAERQEVSRRLGY